MGKKTTTAKPSFSCIKSSEIRKIVLAKTIAKKNHRSEDAELKARNKKMDEFIKTVKDGKSVFHYLFDKKEKKFVGFGDELDNIIFYADRIDACNKLIFGEDGPLNVKNRKHVKNPDKINYRNLVLRRAIAVDLDLMNNAFLHNL